jgi:hypothetical protein
VNARFDGARFGDCGFDCRCGGELDHCLLPFVLVTSDERHSTLHGS